MTGAQFKKKIVRIPESPGVYFFLGKRKELLYIGKATSLRSRVRSYFSRDLENMRGPLISSMVERARTLEWRKTDSVLEALILEANLIKHYKPRYNTLEKDDKSFNYVVITKEKFPRVLLVRGKILESDYPTKMRLYTFGPFPHGSQLKEALRLIRKVFPYRDICTPASVTMKLKACFNRHIRLCPGVCTGEISPQEYRLTITHIATLFQGKKKELLGLLQKERRSCVKAETFERAEILTRQIFALKHIQDVSLIKEEYHKPGGFIKRIEAYDVAHLQGSSNVGVMVVIEEGSVQRGEYRKFRIRHAIPGDDVGALKELLSRRLLHEEWPLPLLIVVDGALPQIRVAQVVLKENGLSIPVVSVRKDEKHRPRDILNLKVGVSKEMRKKISEKDILLANFEAHRFAIAYHRNRSRKERGIY